MTSRTPLTRLVRAYALAATATGVEDDQQQTEEIFPSFVRHAQQMSGGECLLWGELEWMQECGDQSYADCKAFLAFVAGQIAPKPGSSSSAWALFNAASAVPTGLAELDEVLNGGFKPGQLVELVSTPGMGKSIFCLTCLAQLAMSTTTSSAGTGTVVLYVDTERKFRMDRWQEIVRGRGGTEEHAARLQVVHHADDLASLMPALNSRVESLLSGGGSSRLACVVVDSITALATSNTTTTSTTGGGAELYSQLFKLASELKTLAEQCRIPVLVTNQQKTTTQDAAYLGNSWHHVVNVRLFLQQQQQQQQQNSFACRVGKSPDAIECSVPFAITSAGVESAVVASVGAVATSSSLLLQQQQQEWLDLFGSMSQEELNQVLL